MVRQSRFSFEKENTLGQSFGWLFAAFFLFQLSKAQMGLELILSIIFLLGSLFLMWAHTSDFLMTKALKFINITSNMILIISLGLVLREYANIMGGGFNYSVSQSLQVPITIIIGLWMVLFVASYLVLAVKPVVDVLTKTRGRNKTISWLKSLALILVVTGFLTLLLFPSVSIKQVVGVLAFGLVLLSLGIFLELPHREKTGTKAETDQFGKRKNL